MNAEKKLGDLELKVMAILWTSRTPLGVAGVSERLQGERLLAYTTVMTVLVNLYKKGVVDRAKQGKAYLYWAKEGQDKLAGGLFDRLLRGYYNGSVEDFFAAFLRHRGTLTEEDIASIRKQLEEFEARTLHGVLV
ncbi:MAG: BlaI/MecI/CopY family transcriptional regulator [Undibacterium sp.]